MQVHIEQENSLKDAQKCLTGGQNSAIIASIFEYGINAFEQKE